MAKRLHYIDALRVLAVLLLIPFHTGRIFDGFEPFYAKNAVSSHAVDVFLSVVNLWHMPLLFLLAGASSYFALQKRDGRGYMGERAKRLLIPLAFGLLVVVPPQSWYGAMTNAGYTGSFAAFWPTFFLPQADLSGYFGTFTPGHLWFVLFLFVISAAALPVMRWFSGRGERGAHALATGLARPAAWPLVVLAIMISSALPDLGGKNPFYYLAWFLLGYLAMLLPDVCELCETRRWILLAAAAAATVAFVVLQPAAEALPRFSPGDFGFAFLRFAAAWLSVLAILGFGRRYLDRPSRLLAYSAEASYPFYILHQTVIVAVGFYVVQLAWPLWAKFAAIAILGLAGSLAGYEIVRRVPPLRFLFGMKPLPKAPRPVEDAAA